jgi:peptidyl-prolyl cis-trans isomerase A (cyclophilin A)
MSNIKLLSCPHTPSKFVLLIVSIYTLVLSACGGVSSEPSVMVSDIQANQLKYGQATQFTINGYSLDKVINVSTQNCKGLSLVAGGSDSSKSVICTISAVGLGAVSLEAKLEDGTVIKSASFDVPNPQVTLLTNLGTMLVELNPTATPISTDNYLQYVNSKFYDNTIIHRIVTTGIFVAQGGWLTPTPALQNGKKAAIALEVNKGLSNLKGTIAMARGSELNSATSQYFFNLADNAALDTSNGGYAVFGKLILGTEVLDAMAKVKTTTAFGLADFPASNVIVLSATQTK